jgi:hypothetical protein
MSDSRIALLAAELMSARLASSFSQKVIISVSIMVEFEGRLLLIINEVRSDLPNKRLPFQKSNRGSQEQIGIGRCRLALSRRGSALELMARKCGKVYARVEGYESFAV